jgi:hypothetical protein
VPFFVTPIAHRAVFVAFALTILIVLAPPTSL